MNLHVEILADRQRGALRLLGPSTADHNFYLAGGTAVALHLGHRRSVDLDWFVESRIGLALTDMLAWYREKFKVEEIGHVLYALAYFDDADTERMPRMISRDRWREIKTSIAAWVKDL